MSEVSDDVASTGSGPPRPSGNSYHASNLRQADLWGGTAAHPFVRGKGGGGGSRGRGGGGSGGRGRGGKDDGSQVTRFERLSSLALEMDGFRELDDGDSSLFSASVRSEKQRQSKVSKRTRARKIFEEDSDEDNDDDVSVLAPSEINGGDGVEPPRFTKKAKKAGASVAADADMLATAAFGGAGGVTGLSSDEDDEDGDSVASSSQQKTAMKAAFPIKGVTCVGCALAHRIVPVECFVIDNIHRMAPEALFKFAALKYITDVVEPAKKEGILSPQWAWKDLRTHFLLHSSDPRIARASTINTLQTMRQAVENRLVRNDGGDRELDKSSADLMLKIIKSESQERSLLSAALRGDASGKAGCRAASAGSSFVGDE